MHPFLRLLKQAGDVQTTPPSQTATSGGEVSKIKQIPPSDAVKATKSTQPVTPDNVQVAADASLGNMNPLKFASRVVTASAVDTLLGGIKTVRKVNRLNPAMGEQPLHISVPHSQYAPSIQDMVAGLTGDLDNYKKLHPYLELLKTSAAPVALPSKTVDPEEAVGPPVALPSKTVDPEEVGPPAYLKRTLPLPDVSAGDPLVDVAQSALKTPQVQWAAKHLGGRFNSGGATVKYKGTHNLL
jgi:hypothetical protein